MNILRWLWTTPEGGTVRIVIGVGVLAILAGVDIARKGRQATKWREYLFLVSCVAMAMAAAIVNDMVTVTISPTYFWVHENVSQFQRPDVRRLAVSVAMRGSWWAGLLGGVAMLLANNPSKKWRQLPMRGLYLRMACVVAATLAGSALLGFAGYRGWLDFGADDADTIREFLTVGWAHTGAYAGAGIAAVVAVGSVILTRRRLAREEAAASEN